MQVLQDLRIAPNATLAPAELARVADFTSARQRALGTVRRGSANAIRIDATLQDLDAGQTVPLNAMAPNESGLLAPIGAARRAVRENLARGSTDILNGAEVDVVEAVDQLVRGAAALQRRHAADAAGQHQAALKSFEAATKPTSNFALAFSALAQSYSALGYDDEAAPVLAARDEPERRLPPQEKYLIAATHYRIVNDTAKAIEAYENLAKASPNSAMVQFDLGEPVRAERRSSTRRASSSRKSCELDPKFVEGLLALGRVEIRRGNPQASLEPSEQGAEPGHRAQQRRGARQHPAGDRHRLQAARIGPRRRCAATRSRSRSSGGSAKQARHGGEPRRDRAGPGDARQAARGRARASGRRSKLQREIGDKAGIGSTLINLASLLNETLGRPDEALPLLQEALQIRRDVGNPTGEALVLNNIGSVYLAKGQYSEAQTYFERALEIREKAKVPARDGRHAAQPRPRRSPKMGRYDQALAQYLRALDFAEEPATSAAPRSSRTASARSSTTRAATARPSSRRKRR